MLELPLYVVNRQASAIDARAAMNENRLREHLVCAPYLLQMVRRQWRVLMVFGRNVFDREPRRPIEGDETARELIVERKLIAGEQADD